MGISKKKSRRIHFVSILIAAFFVCFEVPGADGARRSLPSKRYVTLPTAQVANLCRDGRQVSVKFTGTYRGRGRVPDRPVGIEGRSYTIGRAIELQNNIVAFIPKGHLDSLNFAADLSRGQQVTVFGITIGRRGGDNYLLAERVYPEDDVATPRAGYELRLSAPRRRTKLIEEPGTYSFDFPCRYEQEETEDLRVEVERITFTELERVLESLSEDAGAEEAEPEHEEDREVDKEEKKYSRYDPITVYQAIGDGRRLHARFSADIRTRVQDFPSTIRDHTGRRVRVGGAFEIGDGPVFCLIPARAGDLMDKLGYILPGMTVRVKGTTLGTVRGDRVFLVDEFEIPGLVEPPVPDFAWLVSLHPGERPPTVFYDVGEYSLRLPCQYEEGAYEQVRAQLRDVQVIEMDSE